MSNEAIINVKGTSITVLKHHESDFISLTDMVKKNVDGGSALIENWLKNKDAVLFLGVWELHIRPYFNSIGYYFQQLHPATH